jgi:hypothetical protein
MEKYRQKRNGELYHQCWIDNDPTIKAKMREIEYSPALRQRSQKQKYIISIAEKTGSYQTRWVVAFG